MGNMVRQYAAGDEGQKIDIQPPILDTIGRSVIVLGNTMMNVRVARKEISENERIHRCLSPVVFVVIDLSLRPELLAPKHHQIFPIYCTSTFRSVLPHLQVNVLRRSQTTYPRIAGSTKWRGIRISNSNFRQK